MGWELRHIRCLVAIAEEGTLTDAAIALGISQAQVSRTLGALEAEFGVKLVRRLAREAILTSEGQAAVRQGRRLLSLARHLEEEVRGPRGVRLGYAWAAVGSRTAELQRVWDRENPGIELVLVRVNGATAGLAEGLVDAAVVRVEVDARRFDSVLIGTERRVAAFAADDPWAARRSIRLADFTERTVLIDSRTGTTTLGLWPAEAAPMRIKESDSVDAWLHSVEAGRGVGITSEATAEQYRRSGVRYRKIVDAPPLAVRLAWHRGEASPALRRLQRLLSRLYA